MRTNDKETLSVAEAVKSVLEGKKIKTETEVQKANKDFVDIHAIDKKKNPEKEKQVEEKDEVEEGNEFTKAAAKAKLAGKDEFEFEGKTYPVEIEQDAAEKILGKKESVELQEAASFGDIEKVMKWAKKNLSGAKLDISKKYGTAFINLTIFNIIVIRLGGKKGIVVTHDDRTNGKGKAYEEYFSSANDVIKFVQKIYDEMPKDESVEVKEMFNRLKPDDVRDSYGTIELKYRSSADIRDAEDKLKKAGINVRKSGDTLEVNSDSPAFKKAKITSSFDSSKREKAIMKVLGESVEESVELEEASNADLKKVLATAKKLGAIVKGNTADFGQGAVIDFSIEKSKIKFDGGMSSGVEYFKNVKDAISALMIGFDE